MRPTFLGFETAKRGISVNQKALDIVANNISNIGVTGYTRQRVDQVSLSTNGVTSRYKLKQHVLAGQGVGINGVSQVRDSYLDKRFRQEYADVGFYSKSSEILTDVETALDEYSSEGLKNALAKFSNAISTLQSDINTTNANIVRTTAKSLTQVLKQFDVKLGNIMEQEKYDLEISVDSANSLLERIASLNQSIQRDVFVSSGKEGYHGPNELLDERNVLLDQLSQYGNIDIKRMGDGTVTVSMGNHVVVEGNKNETISYVRNDDNTVSASWQSNGEGISISSGSLLASLNMINGRGPKAQGNENFERGIPYYMDQVNNFAVTFASEFNKVIPDAENAGEFKTLFTFDSNMAPGAASLSINNTWDEDPSYILTPKSEDGSYDNTYYQSMLSLFSKDIKFDGFKGTLEGFVKNYNTTLGEDKTFHDSRLSATTAISESLLDDISSVSGVSMEEEGAEMLAYTKAFNAMSRVMTALDEALDTLINKTGLVGR